MISNYKINHQPRQKFFFSTRTQSVNFRITDTAIYKLHYLHHYRYTTGCNIFWK